MIKNIETLKKFEKERIKQSPVSIEENFQIFALLKKEAQLLGMWNTSNINDLEIKTNIAKALNNVK